MTEEFKIRRRAISLKSKRKNIETVRTRDRMYKRRKKATAENIRLWEERRAEKICQIVLNKRHKAAIERILRTP
jgi:hypothetical protein